MKRSKAFAALLTLLLLTAFWSVRVSGSPLAADHSCISQFDSIPLSVVQQITSGYDIYYVHTSHGSQIMTGIYMVYDEDDSYLPPDFYEVGSDLGHYGDTSWAPGTRVYLNANPECNMAMFSWCGGVSDNTEEGINAYLSKMEELEAAYPLVKFIYMTGHLDGSGPSGNLYIRNNQIRAYCASHDKTLFDFADIESYDPDGNYYPDESDYCQWCYDWCQTHSCPDCGDCAHSHCFNCYQKGKAWWWMMARLSGWTPQPIEEICGDANRDGFIDIDDVVFLIQYIFAGGPAPNPYWVGDASMDDFIDIDDVVWLIMYIFAEGPEPCSKK